MGESVATSRHTDVTIVPLAASASATGRMRLTYLDNLRTVMIAWIIGGHALLGYTAIGGWPYDEVHEVTFATGTELALAAVLGPSALFVIGTFFFLSGLVGQAVLERRGPARFAADRLLTLAIALRPVPWPAEAKASLVAVLGVPASFWLARRLVRTPVRQVL
jgi:hypothetical protein